MNLSIILVFPWLRKWELETSLYIDLLNWCWFDHRYTSGNLSESPLAKDFDLGSGTEWFNFDVSILCFTFILEGLKS